MKPATKRAPSLQHTGRDIGKASLPRSSRLRLNWLGRVLVALLASGFLLFLGVPLLALLVRESPTVIWAEMGQPDILQALQLSLVTTCLSTAVAVLTGLPVAYLLARTSFPGHKLAETLVIMPTVLPPVVAGVALLLTFGRMGLIGHYLNLMGISIPFTTVAVVMAQVFIAAPFSSIVPEPALSNWTSVTKWLPTPCAPPLFTPSGMLFCR